jgi:hypothetical protein
VREKYWGTHRSACKNSVGNINTVSTLEGGSFVGWIFIGDELAGLLEGWLDSLLTGSLDELVLFMPMSMSMSMNCEHQRAYCSSPYNT